MPVTLLSKKTYPLALALLVLTWTAYMTLAHQWHLFSEFWPASVTMVFGSFIAGSTPAGGGAVAFPVFTKMLHVATDTARTHALMIQAIGMSMASLFILSRGIPIYRRIIKWACLGGTIGMTIGTLFVTLPNPYPKVLFTAVVLAFGINFAICHGFLQLKTNPHLPNNWGTKNRLHFILAGLLGGFISSQTGSGIDLICFILMTLGYGLSERKSIPTSVIIMASMSVLGFFFHGAILQDNTEATKFWLVSVPIVAMGAPLGAFVASHIPRKILIGSIIFLVIIETTTTITFVMIGSSSTVWICAATTLIITAIWLSILLRRRQQLQQGD